MNIYRVIGRVIPVIYLIILVRNKGNERDFFFYFAIQFNLLSTYCKTQNNFNFDIALCSL